MLLYRRRPQIVKTEASVSEAKLRQLNLLDSGAKNSIPPQVEAKVRELLVQLLIGVIAAQPGEVHEQN